MDPRKSTAQQAFEQSLEDAAAELEGVGDEIRLKLHLAGMDANTLWTKELEPRLVDARNHAREAKAASLAALQETIKALRAFSDVI